ncbi:Type II secretion system F domain [Caldicellulosiruptor acetigenus I77R1B]|uniref:Type II secretion system F domain n=1 Tax=Caldicellulosiruptor acetigenus (strain ATCC 700853 / DSM 12137 / I77R1B) TaxID=632335 RepID=E4S4A1_CALA7|nr:type II secretion system F family protein [Caldicellulosiruptor acetigenus]ADQ40338.1 Type II secretion system F domain [Caldicellulosiruptor acetigenus I77R1B]
MAEYIYKAVDMNGKKIEGSVVADTKEGAIDSLRKRNIFVVEIKEKGVLSRDVNVSFRKKLSIKELSMFCRQLSTMLMAGIPLITALSVIVEQFKGRAMGKVLEDIYKSVQSGSMLSRALAEKGECFPEILINMTEAGELSGSLDKTLERMATHFEKELKLKQKIVNALIYPAIVLLVAFGVLVIMLVYVIPTFVGIFDELGVDLPATTKFIIAASNFTRKNIIYIIIVIIFAIIGYKVFRNSEKGGVIIDSLKLKIPLIGKVLLGQATTRFARTLATMTSAGVSIIIALETTRNVINNKFIEKKFEDIILRVQRGEGLSFPIAESGIFPRIVEILIRTGEESGTLDSMLEKTADYFESEVENQVTRLTSVFEPLIIVLLAGMVGFLVSSIILPLFKLYGSIQP